MRSYPSLNQRLLRSISIQLLFNFCHLVLRLAWTQRRALVVGWDLGFGLGIVLLGAAVFPFGQTTLAHSLRPEGERVWFGLQSSQLPILALVTFSNGSSS